MHILIHYNGAYSKNAGVSRVVLGLGEAIAKKGLQVDYAFGYNAPKKMHSYLQALNGILHFLHHTPLTALLFAIFIRNKEYDIVYSHTPEAAFDAVLARLLLRKKFKVVVHLHGLDKAIYEEWKKELRLNGANFNLITFFYLKASIFKGWFGIKLADSFTCISRAVKREAKRFYDVDATIVPNAVDCNEFKKFNKLVIRKKLGFDEGEFIVLFVGNAGWIKGLNYLVEALRELPNAKLIVAGLNTQPRILSKLSDRVIFTGYLNKTELSKYYSMADVLCVPSLYEGFGLVYAEACCFGLPCIASKGTGAEEIIEDGFNGFLVEKRSVAEIKDALKKLRDNNLRKKMGENAKLKAKQLSWENSAEKVLKIFNNLINGVF